jgi:EmrB/QacA subfamily drug resistance transporter
MKPPDSGGTCGFTEPKRQALVLALLCLAQFMVILDITVVNVALPEIGSALELGRETLTWVVTIYTMTLGGLLILAGRVADTFGPRRVFLAGLIVFTATSLTSGLATDEWILLSSRLGQGVGAALLSPAALSLVMRLFTGSARDRALAIWAAIGGAGAAVGVLIGGVLTSGPGWEWAFFINVPIGLAVAVGAVALVPALERRATGRLDLPGAAAAIGTVGLLVLGLTRAGDAGWLSRDALIPWAGSVLLFSVFLFIEWRSAEPLIPGHLIRRTSLPGGLVVMATASAAMVATFFLNSLYLQRIRGFGAWETGVAFLPAAISVVAGAHLARHAISHVGPRATGGLALGLAASGMAVMGMATGNGGGVYATLMPGLVATSVGIGLAFVTATASGLTRIDDAHAGVASGILTTSHELGASLGVAAASALAAASLSTHTTEVSGFQNAYLVSAVGVAAVAFAAATILLPRERPTPHQLTSFTH